MVWISGDRSSCVLTPHNTPEVVDEPTDLFAASSSCEDLPGLRGILCSDMQAYFTAALA